MSRQAASEAFYAALLEDDPEQLYERAPCGYLSTTPDGMVVKANATFLELTGYRREELVGRLTLRSLLSAGGRIYHETHFAPMLLLHGTAREVALEMVRADGERLPVLVNAALESDSEGIPRVVALGEGPGVVLGPVHEEHLGPSARHDHAARDDLGVLAHAAIVTPPCVRWVNEGCIPVAGLACRGGVSRRSGWFRPAGGLDQFRSAPLGAGGSKLELIWPASRRFGRPRAVDGGRKAPPSVQGGVMSRPAHCWTSVCEPPRTLVRPVRLSTPVGWLVRRRARREARDGGGWPWVCSCRQLSVTTWSSSGSWSGRCSGWPSSTPPTAASTNASSCGPSSARNSPRTAGRWPAPCRRR